MNGKQYDEYDAKEEFRQRYTKDTDGCAEIIHDRVFQKRRKEPKDQTDHGCKQQAVKGQFNGVWQSPRQHRANILPG